MVILHMLFPFDANPVRFIRELPGGDRLKQATSGAGTQRRLV